MHFYYSVREFIGFNTQILFCLECDICAAHAFARALLDTCQSLNIKATIKLKNEQGRLR